MKINIDKLLTLVALCIMVFILGTNLARLVTEGYNSDVATIVVMSAGWSYLMYMNMKN